MSQDTYQGIGNMTYGGNTSSPNRNKKTRLAGIKILGENNNKRKNFNLLWVLPAGLLLILIVLVIVAVKKPDTSLEKQMTDTAELFCNIFL